MIMVLFLASAWIRGIHRVAWPKPQSIGEINMVLPEIKNAHPKISILK